MRRVFFVVLPHFVLLDVAGAAEAFRMANQQRPDSYELEFVAPLRSLSAGVGLRIHELGPLPARVPEGSIVVITGVVSRHLQLDSAPIRQLARWLVATMRDESVILMCVCAGSLFAAQAGVLAGRKCTTHHGFIEKLAELEPAATVLANRLFVEDGRIYTSAGVTAGTDLALHLISGDLGPQVASFVARDLVVYMRRSGNDPQLSPWVMYRNHIHPALHRVQDAVSKDPAARWSSKRLAGLACMSERNLARLFAEHAGCSPLDYVQRMRIALARELVTNTQLDLERVAEKSGFSSAHQLRRVWRKWESQPPREARLRATVS